MRGFIRCVAAFYTLVIAAWVLACLIWELATTGQITVGTGPARAMAADNAAVLASWLACVIFTAWEADRDRV